MDCDKTDAKYVEVLFTDFEGPEQSDSWVMWILLQMVEEPEKQPSSRANVTKL